MQSPKPEAAAAMTPCISSPSKPTPTTTTTTINDLPDYLLVEILSRLSHCKKVHRCKCVSKLWCTLISDPYFICRFLCLRRKPLPSPALALIPQAQKDKQHTTLVLLTKKLLSKPHHLVSWKESHLFYFLPGLQGHDDHKAFVLGVCNDLALWCYRHDYYVCNHYTKHWVRLPPTIWTEGPVGFICDPYYYYKDDQDGINSSVKVNADYRWRVVRILPNPILLHGFNVEIFSSETGQWRVYKSANVLCPQQQYFSSFQAKSSGVAYNGKLYWWIRDGFTVELDPFSIGSTSTGEGTIDKCRFIDSFRERFKRPMHISLCRGRLRMCLGHIALGFHAPLFIWELKENQVNGTLEWCLVSDQIFIRQMVPKSRLITIRRERNEEFTVIGFHPDDEDILYLTIIDYVVMCNVREMTLEIAAEIPSRDIIWGMAGAFPLFQPQWPTPVSKLDY